MQADQPSPGQYGRYSPTTPHPASGTDTARGASSGVSEELVRALLASCSTPASNTTSPEDHQSRNGPPEAAPSAPVPMMQASGHAFHPGVEQGSYKGYAPNARIPSAGHVATSYAPQAGGTAAFAGPEGTSSVTIPNARLEIIDYLSLRTSPPQENRAPDSRAVNEGMPVHGCALTGAGQAGLATPDRQSHSIQAAGNVYDATQWQDPPAAPRPDVQPVHGSGSAQSYAGYAGEGAGSGSRNRMPQVDVPTAQPAANAHGFPSEHPAPAFNVPNAGLQFENPPAPAYAPRMRGGAGFAGLNGMPGVPMGGAQPAAYAYNHPLPRYASRPYVPFDWPYLDEWDADGDGLYHQEPYDIPLEVRDALADLQFRVYMLEQDAQRRNLGGNPSVGGGWPDGIGPFQQHDGMSVVQYQPQVNQQVMLDRSAVQAPDVDHLARTPLNRHADDDKDERERRGDGGAMGWAMLSFRVLAVGLMGWLVHAILGVLGDLRALFERIE